SLAISSTCARPVELRNSSHAATHHYRAPHARRARLVEFAASSVPLMTVPRFGANKWSLFCVQSPGDGISSNRCAPRPMVAYKSVEKRRLALFFLPLTKHNSFYLYSV